MLSERLQELEQEGIVERVGRAATRRSASNTRLTKKGRALGKAIGAITDWAHTWIDA